MGILIYAGAFLVGGILQQHRLVNGSIPFVEVMNGTKLFIRVSTLGILLIVLGNAAILCRVALMLRECCRNCCRCCVDEPVTLKPAGAAR